jgi:hypothetical protein
MRIDHLGLRALALICLGVACQRAGTAVPKSPQPQTAVLFAVNASPDSALKLARFSLGAISGIIQLPQVRPTYTSIATHYTRNRIGGGHSEIALIAAVSAVRADSTAGSMVELSAWILDRPHQLTPAQRNAGIPSTAITTNAPANPRPRPATVRDKEEWASIEHVAEVLLRGGARRVP